ncbi:hypothetical protein ZIOFF_001334 [Zingiber officinale]|uniref:Uncharacterized protein n=1 Tax=Zingiber officinale TaxID=94328 RepID=A0A8J5LUY8_ZINOF|nr:hypothetical protein ZIOFF_001334 [Zingiber officinale]
MVLWEITLATAYFLGLSRTYRVALKAQRRLISPRHPNLRQFVHRFYTASLDIVFLILILPFLESLDCSRMQLQDDDDFPEEEFPLRVRTVFDVAVKVHQNIQKQDLAAGKNLGNWILRYLDKAKPSSQIIARAGKPQTTSSSIPRHAMIPTYRLRTQRSITRITDQVRRGQLFFTPWGFRMRAFPTIAMMMHPMNPVGWHGQYRHVSSVPSNLGAFEHGEIGRFEGVFRKDIAQWMMQ